MTQIIGLTGGVGSGKSTVLSVLKKYFHCLEVSTDDISRHQMEPGGTVYSQVVEAFGTGILAEDGTIDRAGLAAVVFADPQKLQQLNALTHPAVTERVLEIVTQERAAARYDAVVIETALLIEGHYDAFCDQVWYVYAPEAERRERLKQSRGYSEEKIADLFARQQSEEAYRSVATAVIDNSDGRTEQELYKCFLELLK
ncbi:MAG: dephospho-CoA kinase [Lachnospiraceae bacterium]|nr:dephospho-CoA kinase [Lachnospiraceae bacterium]